MNGEDVKSAADKPTAPLPADLGADLPRDEAPTLDEATFIKRAKRLSVRRTIRVSISVAFVTLILLTLGWAGWRFAIERQSHRILDYYPYLAQMTMPNNQISGGPIQFDFPGATMRLSAYRQVGSTVVPAGEIGVRFYPWGGESFTPPQHLSDVSDGRMILAPGMIPDLLFLEPPVGGGDASEMWEAPPEKVFEHVFSNARTTTIAKLRSAPPSATVEVAVSFDDVMSLEELQRRLGEDLDLAWGAIRDGSAGASVDEEGVEHEAGSTWWPHLPGGFGTVGIPFHGTGDGADGESVAERETNQLNDFGGLARKAPGLWGLSLREPVRYIENNGAQYYGAVVVGSPEAALVLAESNDVSTVSLGAVTMPWE